MKRPCPSAMACCIALTLLLTGCQDTGSDAAGSPETAAPATGADTDPTSNPKTIPEAEGSDTKSPATNPAEKQIPDSNDKPTAKGDGQAGGPNTEPAVGKAAPPSVDSQMQDLLRLANQSKFDKALEQINIVLARKDLATVEKQKRRAIVFFAAQISQALGQQYASTDKITQAHAAFITSAKHFRTLQTQYKPLFPQETGFGGQVLYNEACTLAANDLKAARASLTEAIELGFDDFKKIKTDTDLEPLRKAPGFQEFIDKQQALAAKKADEAIGKEMAENKPVPFDFKLLDLDGKPFALASLKGKVVVVDVWGTWCPPCRAEVPHFVELQKTYGKQGLQIVGINYERAPDPIPGIKTFAKEYGINYPLVIGDDETQKKIPDFQAFPTTLFIDRKGDVRLVAVGARPHEYLESVVKKLLAETDPPDGLGPAPAGTKKTDKPATKKTTKPATKKTTKPATKKTTKPAGKTIDKPAATKKTAKPAAKKADKPAVKKTTDKT
jgi:thiol-disulfide isomerase/thioredoxin